MSYTCHQGELHFSEAEISILEKRFLNERALLPIYPKPARQRLVSQLLQMIKFTSLQSHGQITNLLRYPVFVAYCRALLGQAPDQFVEFLTLTEPIYPSLNEQRAWSERTCWTILRTKVCNFHRCLDEKKKEYIEYRVICEIETENEDPNGIENIWVVSKRYSDFRNLHLQLKKLDSELGAISFPGRTFLPGRATSQPIIEQRQQQLDEFLQKVINQLQEKIKASGKKDESSAVESCEALRDIISLLDDFLEVTQLDRKPPCKNDRALSCNMVHQGWFSYLWDTKEVHSLHLGFGAINCEALSFLVENNKHIHTLDLTGASGGSLRNDGFRCLLQVLSSNQTGIKQLYLGGYQGHNCDNEDLELFFGQNNTLERLYITGGISISVDDPLLAHASQISSLVVLDLSRCFKKQPKAAQAMVNLAPHLKTHKSLRELYLNENYIGNRGAELLAEALEENNVLQILSLRGCRIGPGGLISLSTSLVKNESLEKLFLTDRPSSLAHGAPSSATVAKAIANMIRGNNCLNELDLSRQYLGDTCKEIVEALSESVTLTSLSLRNNRFIASHVLDVFFKANRSVTSLDVSHNDLCAETEDEQEIEESWKWCPLLMNDKLLKDFGMPWLESKASKYVLEALSKNETITRLEFSSPVDCVKEVEEFFLANDTVEEIVGLESPQKGFYSVHSAILSHKGLKRLHWVNMDQLELRRFTQNLAARQESSPLYFSFTLSDPEAGQLDSLRLIAPILPQQ